MKFSIQVPTYRITVNVYISKNDKKLDNWHNSILKSFGKNQKERFNAGGMSYSVYVNKRKESKASFRSWSWITDTENGNLKAA